MDNNLDDQLLIMQSSIEANKQYTDNKMKKHDSEFTVIRKILKQLMVQNHNSSPDKVEPPKAQDCDTVVPANKKAPTLEGERSMKFCGIWTLKHKIILSEFYEILTKKELNETLYWTSIILTTISICVSLRLVDSEKTPFLLNIPSNNTPSLNNTSCQIFLSLTITIMPRHTPTLDNPFWWP